MTLVQVTSLFNYHLLAYLTNRFAQVYLTGMLGVSSEFVANFASGLILEKFGARASLISFYTCCGVGGVLMLTYGLAH